jgi:RHS repeat-associated protein
MARRAGRRARRVVAVAVAPVMAASGLTPVAAAAAAGVALGTVAAVSSAAPAKASTTGPVLVLLQNGETTAPETTVLQNAGYTVTQATPSTWSGMSTAAFEAYAALVIGDPSSGGSCSSLTQTTSTLGTAWQGAVSGNLAVLGTAPAAAGTSAAHTLITDAVNYAAAGYSSSSSTGTGLYVSLNCEYSTASAGTAVPLLNGVEGIGTAGGLTVQGSLSCSDAGTVNTWEATAAGTFGGFTSSQLSTTSWPSPACPVEEAFDKWPAEFTPVGYDAASDATANFTASDGSTGQPYLLLGAPASLATQALAPSAGGEIPADADAGGQGNTADPGASAGQTSAGDPVNTENGDFTQSDTDLSIAGFGPALDFTRTYDAQQAEQQTEAAAPGAMGYGWTDNWASSLTATDPTPVPADIYTLDGLATDTGDGLAASQAPLNNPGGLVYNGGNLYIADTSDNRVQEVAGSSGTQWGISMTAGDVYTIAGAAAGAAGYVGDGGAAGSALLHAPRGLAFDSAGDLYIADSDNNRIQEIAKSSGTQWGISMTAGDIYTVAGSASGSYGDSGDGAASTSALLDGPVGLAIPASGSDVYVADAGNNRVQEMAAETGTQWGQSMTTGDIYTVAGSATGTAGDSGDGGAGTSAKLGSPEGVTLDSSGDLYVADSNDMQVQEVAKASGTQWGQSMTAADIYTVAGSTSGTSGDSGDGGAASSALLDWPSGVLIGNGGQLYIADYGNNRIQEVAGTTHTEWGQSMTANDIYTIAGSATGSGGFSGDGAAATSALLLGPFTIALDSSDDLYIADYWNDRVREVSASTYKISTFAGNGTGIAAAGDGGPATGGELIQPTGEAVDAVGDVYIADSGNNRIQEIAATTHTQYGISMTGGDVYTVAGNYNGASGDTGDGGAVGGSLLDDPTAIILDNTSDLYIADEGNNRVQEVAATSGTQWGQSMTGGDIYTIAGSATGAYGTTGDGGAAASALLYLPRGLALDHAGDLYIADAGNNRIQEIDKVSGTQWGQSMTGGDIYTVAGSSAGTYGNSGDGGAATSALLHGPAGVTLDPAGNLYIADYGNNRVQEVAAVTGTQRGTSMTKNDIYTIAGSATGTSGLTGDGGPAASALLDAPSAVAADSSGNLYIADGANNRTQEIAVASGTQWGQSMTAGDIYTVGGSAAGTSGESGDGGPATSALMDYATGVTADAAGNLYVTDLDSNRVRMITANAAITIATPPTATSSLSPAPGGITVTQPGGAQVSFQPKTGGSCTSPYVTAGGYCTMPQVTATLTYSSSSETYTFTPTPGTTDTFGSNGLLTKVADAAGDTATITYGTPAPGSGQCPSAATSCDTVTSAAGRPLVIGITSGLVTSVTDPMGREWTYGYTGADLTSVTDPLNNKTTYTYGVGSTGNPLLANDLLTITSPNAQPGGPDAGDDTVNVYNASGQVTSQTDPTGHTTTFSYTGMNIATGTGIVTVADPDGNTAVYDYTQGALAAQSEWTGTTFTSEQDDTPDTTASTTANPSGGTLLDTTSTNGDGDTTSYTYNASGDSTSATAPDGVGSQMGTSTTQYTSLNDDSCDGTTEASTPCSSGETGPSPVAPGGVITPPSSAPPAGVTYSLYDTEGNQLYTTTGVYEPGRSSASYLRTTYQLFKGNSVTINGTNIACTYTPPSQSLPCATINADGVVTQLEYDTAGDLTLSSTPDGNGSQLATAIYTYDADGEQLTKVAPDGNVSGANAGNFTTTTAYNADGEKTSVTEGNGSGYTDTPRVTRYGYDGDGNQASVEDARGYTTTTTFNADNEVTLVENPDSDETLTCYDGDGNIAQTVPPVGVAANSLTAASCPTSYPSGYSDRLASDAAVSTFNALGMQTQQTTPAPAGQSGYETTTYTYDGNDNPLTTTAPPTKNGGSSQVTVDTYDAAGQLASQTTGSGTSAASTLSYCYDPDGHKTSVVYADGNTSGTAACSTSSPWTVTASPQASYQTTYSYDSVGELVSTITPANTASSTPTTTVTYDPAGNMLTRTDPDSVTTTWTYTPLDKVATISYSGSSAHSVSYTYDANSNQTAMTDATGSSSYFYDPFGELTSAINGSSQTVGYGYNADGDVTGITYPLPLSATWATTDTVSYGYDQADNLTSVTDFNNHQITVTPDADSLPSSETLGSTGDTISYSYDPTDYPSAISLKNSSSTLQSFTYSNSPAATILSETDTPSSSNSPADYTYDAQSRIASDTPGTGTAKDYSFDASSNLTTLATGAAGTYNDAGELTSSALSGTTTDYTYNGDGEQLSSVQGSTTESSATWNGATELATYDNSTADMTAATYNGNGLRASTTITPAGGSAVAQDYVWNTIPQVPGLLMDGTNAYIYDGGLAPAEQVSLAAGTITYLVSDALGSVRGMVNVSGSLTATTSYDAWGNPETTGGLTATTPFGFAGGYTDADGLIYLINRYYQPSTGQFISVDPLLSQTLQPYQYASGDPTVNTDPSGNSTGADCIEWGFPDHLVCIQIIGSGLYIDYMKGWMRNQSPVWTDVWMPRLHIQLTNIYGNTIRNCPNSGSWDIGPESNSPNCTWSPYSHEPRGTYCVYLWQYEGGTKYMYYGSSCTYIYP